MERNFVLLGQVKSGKNNMIVTRRGLHFPKPEWERWRDETVKELIQQMGQDDWQATGKFSFEVSKYVPCDKRRRDVPGMIDALFHCFEKSGLVKDDSLIKKVYWCPESEPSKKPMIEFTVRRIV